MTLILIGIPCSLAFGYLFWLKIEPYHRTRAIASADANDIEHHVARQRVRPSLSRSSAANGGRLAEEVRVELTEDVMNALRRV